MKIRPLFDSALAWVVAWVSLAMVGNLCTLMAWSSTIQSLLSLIIVLVLSLVAGKGGVGERFMQTGLGITTVGIRQVLAGAFLSCTMLALYCGTAMVLGAIFDIRPDAAITETVVWILAWAAMEELVFRGKAFQLLQDTWGTVTAVVITSAIFTLAHSGNPELGILPIINIFLAGLLFGTMRGVTSSLWSSIGAHAMWNLLVAIAIGSVSGFQFSDGLARLTMSNVSPDMLWVIHSAFGAEGTPVISIVLIVGIIVSGRLLHVDPYAYAAQTRIKYTIIPQQ